MRLQCGGGVLRAAAAAAGDCGPHPEPRILQVTTGPRRRCTPGEVIDAIPVRSALPHCGVSQKAWMASLRILIWALEINGFCDPGWFRRRKQTGQLPRPGPGALFIGRRYGYSVRRRSCLHLERLVCSPNDGFRHGEVLGDSTQKRHYPFFARRQS